jgi:uncharacterized protein (TIGR04551 family)
LPLYRPRTTRALAFAAVWAYATLGFAMPAAADEPTAPSASAPVQVLPEEAPDGSPAAVLRWGGLMRLRGQWIEDGSLGNGTSGLPATLSAPDRLAQADLRLRLTPTLELGSYARIQGMVDVAGRTVLGSDARDDSIAGRALSFEGSGPVRDAFAARRLWASFDVFGLATVDIGRMGDHFGLGIARNDGRDPRADWQSDVDRVRVAVELFGLRIRVMRDNMATTPMLNKGLGAEDPVYPLADSTDVVRWLAEVEDARPADAPGLHWAFALGYQDQAVALALEHGDDPQGKLQSDCIPRGTCVQLVTRGATLVLPQVYLAWNRKRPWGELHFAVEGAARLGTIDNTDALASTDTSKTIVAGAFAAEAGLRLGRQHLRVQGGYASGDGEGGFGVLDRQNLTRTTPAGEVHRSLITGYAMHRGYLVDGLLFREVIGAVANAAWVRPAWRMELWLPTRDSGLTLEAAALLAMSARIGATPGRARWLGIEPELRVDWRTSARTDLILQGSLLLPGDAFDAGQGGKAASMAGRVSLDWILRF